ncbi:thioredoxin domain-containing protein [Streptomyces showdoensis]
MPFRPAPLRPRDARERMRHERRRDEIRKRRVRRAAITGGIALALAGNVVLTVMVRANRASDDRPVVTPAGVTDQAGLVISVGRADAPAVMTIYEDLRCPGCARIERTLHETINRLEDAGKLRVDYHILSFVDRIVPGEGSRRAANALAAAQDAGRFRAYHDVLYAHPPVAEDVDTFGDKDLLLKLAQKVGLSGERFTAAVREGTHDTWVAEVQRAFDQQDEIQGTPALLFKGHDLLKDPESLSPERLTTLVEQEVTAHGT